MRATNDTLKTLSVTLFCATGRLLCEVHEEFQTNIALALRGFWVSSYHASSEMAPAHLK